MSGLVAEKLNQGFNAAFEKLQMKGIRQGKVTEVHEDLSCTVELEPGLELYDVRLNSIVGDLDTMFIIKPKLQSIVLVGVIENLKTETVVLACSEIDEILVKAGTAIFRIKDSKVKIEAEGVNLGEQLSQFIGEVKKIIVLYGRSPDIAALTLIDENIKKILD